MTDSKPKTKTGMENAHTVDPLDPKAANPSENSRPHASTAIQSETNPDAYPAFEREAQVEQATGRPASDQAKPD